MNNLYDAILISLRTQAPTLSVEDTEKLANLIIQRVESQANLTTCPESLLLSKLGLTVQLMLAQDHSSIENAAQQFVQVLYFQLTEDLASSIPEHLCYTELCPYPGLAAFDEANATYFSGREDDIDLLLNTLNHPVVVLTGPSGVGKSSIVQAGLIPELRRRGSDEQLFLKIRLSTNTEPFASLSQAFSEVQVQAALTDDLLAAVLNQDDGLLCGIVSLRSYKDQRVFVVLDQFEEIFVGDDPERVQQRRRMLDNILWIDAHPEEGVTIIITTRENYFEHPDYVCRSRLAELIQRQNVPIDALTTGQLRRAIEQPLKIFNERYDQGLQFQEGLVDIIVQGFQKPTVSLPLVQYLLRLLWIEQHRLTHFAYNRLGGLERALDRHASAIYEDFSESDQKLVKALLISLVGLGLESEYVRKRIRRNLLLDDQTRWQRIQRIIQRLTDPRSRIISEQQIGGVVYFELTHEVLLRQWSFLRELIEARKSQIEQRDRLWPIADLWMQSKERLGPNGDPTHLFRGTNLVLAKRHLDSIHPTDETDQTITACYIASCRHRRRTRANIAVASIVALVAISSIFVVALNMFTAETQRQRDEQQKLANARATAQAFSEATAVAEGQARGTAVALQAFSEATAVAEGQARGTAVALQAFSEATAVAEGQARGTAVTLKEEQEKLTQIRQLVSQAEIARNESSALTERSLLLSVEAAHRALDIGAFTTENERSLRSGLALQIRPLAVITGTEVLTRTVFSKDETTVAVFGATSTVIRRISEDGDPQQFTGTDPYLSPDGTILATHTGSTTTIWDTRSGTQLGDYASLFIPEQFSADWRYLVYNDQNAIRIVKVADGSIIRTITPVDAIIRLLFSPDGTYVAGIEQGNVRIWTIADSRRVITIPYSGTVLHFSFTPNSQSIILGTGEPSDFITYISQVAVWRLGEAQEVLSITEPLMRDLTISSDGRYIAVISGEWPTVQGMLYDSNTLWVGNIETGRHTFSLSPEHGLIGLIFSPNSKYIVFHGTEGSAYVLDAETGEIKAHPKGEAGLVGDVAFSLDNTRIAIWSYNPFIGGPGEQRVWDIENDRSILALRDRPLIGFTDDARAILTSDQGAVLWDIAANRELARYPGDGFTLSPSHKYAVTSNSEGVYVWPVNKTPMEEAVVVRNGSSVFSSDVRFLAAPNEPLIRFINLQTGQEQVQSLSRGGIIAASIGIDTHVFAVATTQGDVKIWDASTNQLVKDLAYEGDVLEIITSDDGRFLAVVGSKVTIWATGDWSLVSSYMLPTTPTILTAHTALFSQDSRSIIIAGTDGVIRQWMLNGTLIREFKAPDEDHTINALALSKDGRYLAAATGEPALFTTGIIDVWDLTTGAEIQKYESYSGVTNIEFSPDGHYLATTSADIPHNRDGATFIADLWSVNSDKPIMTFGPNPGVLDISFSPDGKYLVTAELDGTARIISIETQTEVTQFTHARPVEQVVFSENGQYLLTETEDHTTHVWLWQPRGLIAEACHRLTRNLTQGEWKRFLPNEPYRQTCSNLPVGISAPVEPAQP